MVRTEEDGPTDIFPNTLGNLNVLRLALFILLKKPTDKFSAQLSLFYNIVCSAVTQTSSHSFGSIFIGPRSGQKSQSRSNQKY